MFTALSVLCSAAIALAAQPSAPASSAPPPASGPGSTSVLVFTGAKIITADTPDGGEINDGVLIIQNGKIGAVGPAATTTIPGDATLIDLKGKVIMPGLVDTHSHIGGIGGDGSAPLQPDIRIFDELNVFDPGYRRAVAGGLTTLNVMPGSGHLLSGQTVYLKLRQPAGKRPHQIGEWFMLDGAGQPLGGLKMANGTNPLRDPPFPGSRGKSAALVRQQWIKAQEYRDKIAKAAKPADAAAPAPAAPANAPAQPTAPADDAAKPAATIDPDMLPARDIGLDAMVECLNGTRIVQHHTHRADDIMTVIRTAREFKFRVVLHHVSEAWKVADELAQAQKEGILIGCSVILVDSPGGKLEAAELNMETGAALEKAGVQFSYHTDDWITDCRLFLRMAALGVRAGASRAAAIRALTLSGAEQMDLQDRVGSLAPGKDADFIVLSGDPFSVYTRVEQTWIEGERVFDLANPEDRLWADGGLGAGNPLKPYMCCEAEHHAGSHGGGK
jgi:imidazolonepropionase-like amidohydrolase